MVPWYQKLVPRNLLFFMHIPVVVFIYHQYTYLRMYLHFDRCISWMFSPSRRHRRTTTRVHFLSMHKDDIERAGIPGRRVFFDFCPNNVEKKRKEEKRREAKKTHNSLVKVQKKESEKECVSSFLRKFFLTFQNIQKQSERHIYYACILRPQHQHYAEIVWPRSVCLDDDDDEEGEGDKEDDDEHQVRQIKSRRRYSRAVGNTF